MKSLIIVLLSVACALASPTITPIFPEDARDSRFDIVGGFPANRAQFPYQGRIIAPVSPTSSQVCGCSIISEDYVLTAAHCTAGLRQFDLGFGSTDFQNPPIKITSTSKVEHPQYNAQTLANDVAIISLPTRLTWSETVRPINLPTRSSVSNPLVNEQVIASGFGLTRDGGSVSETLNYVRLRVIGNSECASVYGGSVIRDSTLCTRGLETNGQSTCQGDSGGPLAHDGVLVGVTSFVSSRGCASGDPAGFARTNQFLDWINTQTGIPIRP